MGMLQQAAQQTTAPDDETQEAPTEDSAEQNTPAAPDKAAATGKAYASALDYLQQILYSSDQASRAIVKHFQPQNKVGSTAYTVAFLIGQVMSKIPLVSTDVFKLVKETTDRLIEMFTRAVGAKFSPAEQKQVLATATKILTQAMQAQGQRASQGAQAPQPPSENQAEPAQPGGPNVQEQAEQDTAQPVPDEQPPQETPPGQPPVNEEE